MRWRALRMPSPVDSFVPVELHQKRYRGPRILWPIVRPLTNAIQHLPHWARSVHEVVDRAAYETTIIKSDPPPPPAGVRQPRRPTPTAPPSSLQLPLNDPEG